jgi:Sigma-54, DNA binding domain
MAGAQRSPQKIALAMKTLTKVPPMSSTAQGLIPANDLSSDGTEQLCTHLTKSPFPDIVHGAPGRFPPPTHRQPDRHILQPQGIHVTRRPVVKYREDMRIPSTHQRRMHV